ncbi:MAG: NAD(P)-dependent oxidoreductase, partial [Phenylobacterium sp.]
AVQALGAEVLYTARGEKADAVGRFCTLTELLEQADIVSLHVPLTSETREMIDAIALWRMKRGAILINTARGELVDQDGLCEALTAGQLAGAGLDVFYAEPVDQDEQLFNLPNVVLAPHVAWLTPETLGRSLDAAMENCRRLAAGQPLNNQVV